MAIKKIPVSFNSPDFNFQIELDLVVFGFRFIWNERTNRFSLSITTEEGVELVSGITVVTNWKLLARFKDSRLPLGQLFTADMTGGSTEPDPVTFGDTVLLCYNEALA